MQQMIIEDPQEFYKHVNLLRKYCDDLPSIMSYDNKNAKNNDDIADCFRIFFQSIYSKPNDRNVKNFEK